MTEGNKHEMKVQLSLFVMLACIGAVAATVEVSVSVGFPARVWTNAARRVVYDFGRDAFGWAEARNAAGKEANDGEIEIRLGEKIEGDAIDMAPGGSRRAAKCSVGGRLAREWRRVPLAADLCNTRGNAVKLPPEIGVVLPFRYVEVPVGVDVRRKTVAVPMDMEASSFTCSDSRLNDVYDFCKYTILATSFAGIYVDGDRERIPYEADAYINMLGEQAVWADGRMAKATIEHLLDHPTWPTEWRLHMPTMAHDHWMATGDLETARMCYGKLKASLLCDRAREQDGLLSTAWKDDSPIRDIVDWPVCERDGFVFTNVNAVVNAFHIRALRNMAKLAAAIGETGDACRFAVEAKTKAKAFQAVFVDPATGLVRDGEGVDHISIHANIIALAFGLVPEPLRGKTMEYVRSRGMACSTYFAHYLLEACFESGDGAYALSLMTDDGDRSWLGMKKDGATMCMESWSEKVKPNQDWNHAWSTAPLNAISRFVLGVSPLEPGAGKVSVAPNLCGMEFMEGVVPTARGSVKVRASGKTLVVETPVPACVAWGGRLYEVDAGKHQWHGDMSNK